MMPSTSLKRAAMLAALLFIAACSSESNPTLPIEYGDLLFPRQKAADGERIVMQALLIGPLVTRNDCLRIDSRHGETSYLPIWPPDYGLKIEGNIVNVVDGTGRTLVRVGQAVYMGGGEIHSLEGIAAIDAQTKQAVAERCGGPYWIVGEGTRPATDSD